MKFSVQFFLSLCFLLIGGHIRTNAHSLHNHVRSDYAQHHSELKQAFFSKSSPSRRQKRNTENNGSAYESCLEDEYQEDDESTTLKRLQATSNYVSAWLQTLVSGPFFNYIRTRLAFDKDFSYFTFRGHIVYRVILV